jgi:putative DNA primase/helicase
MTHAIEPLPPALRSLDERADRDLALLDRLKPSRCGSAPAETHRDNRDNRDTAPDKASDCPGSDPDDRDNRDKTAPRPHFLLLEAGRDSLAAGVYWHDVARDKDGEVTGQAAPVWICSPLRVAALTRDTQGSEWGRLLVFPDRDGRVHRWTMPMRMLAGSGEELRSELLAEGLTITSSGRDRQRLVDYIGRGRPDVTARCVTRTGWHGDVFTLPRETFGDTDAEPVLFQSSTLDGVALGQGGTLDGWRDHVAACCAGNARLVLAICAGFAGPCLGMLGMDGGGFHLRGASSTGKSTALSVAASLFGSPAYLRTWRHTDNGLEGVAALHSDLLLILDEIGQLDPKHAGQVAYLLANGQGKGRSHRDGSPRAITTWRLLFLSAGEIGLGDLVTQSGGKVRAGQEVRVIDLPADAGAGLGLFDAVPDGLAAGAFADALKTSAAKHYGHALPAFLRALVADPARAREVLRQLRDDIAGELVDSDAAGQVRRVAERFALVAAAGELATAYRLTGWQTGEAQHAAKACFSAWLASRGTAGAAEPAAMLDQVRAFLSANGEARFTEWNADAKAPRTINRAGFRKDDTGGPTYYIEREAFRREVCAGFDAAAVVRVLVDAGALLPGSGNETTRKERLPDGRSVRVYVVLPALWGDA